MYPTGKKKSRGKSAILILAQSAREKGGNVGTSPGANLRGKNWPEKLAWHQNSYLALMMKCLKYKATPRKNANVLYHMMGYFKKQLEPDEKQELVESIEHYRLGYYPLIAPIMLFKHYVRKYQQSYLKDQCYLNPHPVELKLRNHD